MGFGQWVNNNVHLPFGIDLGVGEALGGQNTYSTTINGQTVTGQAKSYADFVKQAQSHVASQNPVQPVGNDGAVAPGGGGGGSAAGGSGAAAGYTADDISFLQDQANRLQGLLGRADTALNQGLQRNEEDYNTNVDAAGRQKEGLITDDNTAKLGAFNTIDRNANSGYRSLAQIIGRAAGTGSSAFQEALPDAVGKDTSSKRQNATVTHDTNQSKIETSFADVMADLLKQKKSNEENVRTSVAQQKQGIEGQLAENNGQIATARGGGYAQVKAAQAPHEAAIEQSRNSVEGLFNTLRPGFTPKAVAADTAAYNTDRSVINAEQDPQNTMDPTNPYAALLKKKMAGVA